MARQEVPQRHEQLARMLAVVAGQRRADVVAQHVADGLGAVLLVQEIVGERYGGDLRNVLMLGNGEDLLLAQVTQGDAVLQTDHGSGLPRAANMTVS